VGWEFSGVQRASYPLTMVSRNGVRGDHGRGQEPVKPRKENRLLMGVQASAYPDPKNATPFVAYLNREPVGGSL